MVFGQNLDLIILEVFAQLNDSIILWFIFFLPPWQWGASRRWVTWQDTPCVKPIPEPHACNSCTYNKNHFSHVSNVPTFFIYASQITLLFRGVIFPVVMNCSCFKKKKSTFPSVNILLEFLKLPLAVAVSSCPQPLFEVVGSCEIPAVIHLRNPHREYHRVQI